MTLYSEECLNKLQEKVKLHEVISLFRRVKESLSFVECDCMCGEGGTIIYEKGASHYHCYGCSAHGDALEFMLTHLLMPFDKSIELLSIIYDVKLEKCDRKYVNNLTDEERSQNRKKLFKELEKMMDQDHIDLYINVKYR
jgi:DNA primase